MKALRLPKGYMPPPGYTVSADTENGIWRYTIMRNQPRKILPAVFLEGIPEPADFHAYFNDILAENVKEAIGDAEDLNP